MFGEYIFRRSRTELFCEKVVRFLYIAWLISIGRKVCLYLIYCWIIWFNYIRIINKRNAFNSLVSWKWESLWFLAIYYSLGSPCCFKSDSSTSACTDHFCKKMFLTFLFFTHDGYQRGLASIVCTFFQEQQAKRDQL